MTKVRYYTVTATSRYVGMAWLHTPSLTSALAYIEARQDTDYDRFTLTSFTEK